jgi:hypothetical protein
MRHYSIVLSEAHPNLPHIPPAALRKLRVSDFSRNPDSKITIPNATRMNPFSISDTRIEPASIKVAKQ